MKISIGKNWRKFTVLILSLFVIYLATFAKLDSAANSRLDLSFKQALGVFATTKALNGVISLVQGTEIRPPGVTISIGEILDPINDLVERFSWIMLASLTSLGIQKILMNIVVFNWFKIVLIATLILANILYFFDKYKKSHKTIFNFAILLVFLRFSIPFMAMTNEYVYIHFIKQNYNIEQSENIIKDTKTTIGKFDDKKASYFSTDYFSTEYYKNKMQEFQKSADRISDHIVDLIIVFIFQTMLFPILFLWFLYRIFISFSKSFHNP